MTNHFIVSAFYWGTDTELAKRGTEKTRSKKAGIHLNGASRLLNLLNMKRSKGVVLLFGLPSDAS